MDRGDIVRWVLVGLSFAVCVVAIWMMVHGWEIAGTPDADVAGMGLPLFNFFVGFVWMLCGLILVLLAGQGLITGIVVGFLPREQWEEHDLDNVPVSTQEDGSSD
jgi:hypothetical protein